ncbi:MAG: DNA alkylation repair protein [Acidobacteriota bacterium]
MNAVQELHDRLAPLGTTERATHEKKYLKSDLDFLGVPVPLIRKEVRRWSKEQPTLTRAQLLATVRGLWRTRVHELRSFGAFLLTSRLDLLEVADFALLENLLRRAKTWAHVDALAVHGAGPLVEQHPAAGSEVLDRWIADDDFWIRRSAILALLLPLRRGGGDWPRFVRYGDRLLDEKEFFLRKAIGWVARETSKERPEIVVDWVRRHLDRMSGVTFREAVRRLPDGVREELTAAYKGR